MSNVEGAFFRILSMSKLDTIFEIYDSVPAGLAAFNNSDTEGPS